MAETNRFNGVVERLSERMGHMEEDGGRPEPPLGTERVSPSQARKWFMEQATPAEREQYIHDNGLDAVRRMMKERKPNG